MIHEQAIPLIVGVTGHRDLREAEKPRIYELVRDFLNLLRHDYPHTPLVMLNALAEGADTLCARVARELDVPYICPLPMEADAYRKDFEGKALKDFDELLGCAERSFVVRNEEDLPDMSPRDICYRAAGAYIARHCHVLLALWDGMPSPGAMCGTAAVTDFVLKANYVGGQVLDCGNSAVMWLSINRVSGHTHNELKLVPIENRSGPMKDYLSHTDIFNRDIFRHPAVLGYPLPVDSTSCRLTKRLSALYRHADGLSTRFQKYDSAAIAALSVSGMLMILLLLVYGETDRALYLYLYALVFAASFFLQWMARRQDVHGKYLQYRVLAETLRVQTCLSMTDTRMNVADAFTWTQKQDAQWIRCALWAIDITGEPRPAGDLRALWIDDQAAYHRRAGKRDGMTDRRNAFLSSVLVISTLVFCAVLIFVQFRQNETLKGWLNIALCSLAAFSMFLSAYYGKKALSRKVADRKRMVALYETAAEKWDDPSVDRRELVCALARQEVVENGNWYSYCLENEPRINL